MHVFDVRLADTDRGVYETLTIRAARHPSESAEFLVMRLLAYCLEYGEGILEMHKESIREGSNVLVVDDLLATGGTAAGAAELVRMQGGHVLAFAFVIELTFLGGRERLLPTPVMSLVTY